MKLDILATPDRSKMLLLNFVPTLHKDDSISNRPDQIKLTILDRSPEALIHYILHQNHYYIEPTLELLKVLSGLMSRDEYCEETNTLLDRRELHNAKKLRWEITKLHIEAKLMEAPNETAT